MCGILGHIQISTKNDPLSLACFLSRMRHRGPDDSGQWRSSCGRVILGHNRLSIQDLTSASHQPMISSCQRYAIVFNGEIYNFQQLRSQLITEGVSFASTGDTEVIFMAYKVWGESFLARLNGMFAFAIYDQGTASQPPTLFFARDRAGEKPFYYSHTAESFRFPLSAAPSIDAR